MIIIYKTIFRRDAADKVVERKGKFEELVVSSNEIAASTAQLVRFDTLLYPLIALCDNVNSHVT